MKIYLRNVEDITKIVDSNNVDITDQEMAKIRSGKHFIKQDEYERGKRDMEKYINENDSHSSFPAKGENKKQPRRDAPLPKFKL